MLTSLVNKPQSSFFQLRTFTNYQHSNASLAELKEASFVVKNGYTGAWTEEEEKSLQKFLRGFAKNPYGNTYPDLFEYVSRHVLKGSKSRDEVKKRVSDVYHAI